MTRRNQIASALLVVVLAIFGYVMYSRQQPVVVANATGNVQGFVPLPVENPALRVDLLAELKKFQYQGPRRNIFSAVPLPAPVEVEEQAPPPVISGPVQMPGPPPLVVPATFFGRIVDRTTGTQRAFFSESDNVHVLALGEVLMNRFRLVQIGETTAELEEISSGRRTTVTMERPAS